MNRQLPWSELTPEQKIQTRQLLLSSGAYAGNLANLDKAPPETRARLKMLWMHWQDTRNTYLALDAITLCVAQKFSPPSWALKAILLGLQQHLEHPDRDLMQQLDLRRRGSGKTQPIDQFHALCALNEAMSDMWWLCESMNVRQHKAAEAVRLKYDLPHKPDTLCKLYRKKWRPHYRGLGRSSTTTDEARRRFRGTFPEQAQRLIPRR